MFKNRISLSTSVVSLFLCGCTALHAQVGIPANPDAALLVSEHASALPPAFGASNELPDAPQPAQDDPGAHKGARLGERILNAVDPGSGGVASKWDVTINKGERVRPFNAVDKIHYAWTEESDPAALFTAAWSAGYEQLRDVDPHYGSDSAAYGERFGAAAFRQGVNRLFGDGILPALTHEDPRFYRVADRSIWVRALGSADQVVLRHRDNGTIGFNYSGFAGHAMADGLPITFYPQKSAKARVALVGFGTSLAADAGLKLTREFLPDILQAVGLLPKRSVP